MGSKYRENAKRAIYLTEEIDRKLVAKLSPEILRLRLESSEPIFLYIDSLGGSTLFAEKLLSLIRTPDQVGNKCEVVSVGVGFAASAAADILALGDYSIAYPNSHIHYHGTRQSKDEITLEDIQRLAHSLRETNETYALRLASRVFKRMVFRMLTLSLEPRAKRESNLLLRRASQIPRFSLINLRRVSAAPLRKSSKPHRNDSKSSPNW